MNIYVYFIRRLILADVMTLVPVLLPSLMVLVFRYIFPSGPSHA
jgi:hypothetical protein